MDSWVVLVASHSDVPCSDLIAFTEPSCTEAYPTIGSSTAAVSHGSHFATPPPRGGAREMASFIKPRCR